MKTFSALVIMMSLFLFFPACDEGQPFTPGDGAEDQQVDDTVGDDAVTPPDAEVDPGDPPPPDQDVPVDEAPDTCVAVCGNSIRECAEQCDDGNTTPGDGCDASCMIEAPPNCGDGNVDYADGEQCDDGNTAGGDGCSATCQIEAPSTCGDGILDIDNGEQCDDANLANGDGCSSTCQFEPVGETCGNDTQEGLEACDDGNLVNGDGCNPTCNMTNTTTLFVGSPGQPGLVDGTGSTARLGGYGTLTADAAYLYFSDGANNVVRRIEIATATVQTIAGDAAGGTAGYVDDPDGANARFGGVESITTDGNTVWVSDNGNHRLRAVNLSPPFAVTTVAGSGIQGHTDGIGTAAEFDDLRGLTYYNGYVYFLDANAATLRRLDPVTTEVITLAGSPYVTGQTDGLGTAARFISPRYMASNNSGMLYVSDTNGNMIRSFNTVTTYVGTFAGTGACGYVDAAGTAAAIHRPRGMTSDGTSIYWCEFNAHTIRQAILATAEVTTMIGTPLTCTIDCSCGTPPPVGGYAEGVGSAAQLSNPFTIVFHYPSGSLFWLDGGSNVIRRVQ